MFLRCAGSYLSLHTALLRREGPPRHTLLPIDPGAPSDARFGAATPLRRPPRAEALLETAMLEMRIACSIATANPQHSDEGVAVQMRLALSERQYWQ